MSKEFKKIVSIFGIVINNSLFFYENKIIINGLKKHFPDLEYFNSQDCIPNT